MTRWYLIVGGAGYIGSHMVRRLLAAGHKVTVFDNFSRGHRDAVMCQDLVEGDLTDISSLRSTFAARRIDVVMHFAALAYVGESVAEPARYYRNNVIGSLNLFDEAVAAGVKRLVFSSTCATYGHPLRLPMAEDHPQRPINPYGASKLMVERILQDYNKAYGLESISLRYFNAAGCHPDGSLGERHDPETHLIPLALAEALRVRHGGVAADTSLVVHGNDYDTRDGTCVRDYVHVDDLAAAHLAAAERLLAGPVGATALNLGTGRGHSVLEVLESVKRVSGQSLQFRFGPRRSGDPPTLVADASAAAGFLGWRAEYVDLDRIIETAWAWQSKATPVASRVHKAAG